MKFGSVCSGIEGASVAWEPLGWRASWFAEIEPFPSAVLAHHYPTVPNHGDMTLLPQKVLDFEVDAPDILCGGTPCQAFSVAGLRRSLDDARGNLSLIFCELANAIDTVRAVWGLPPAIVFWENVPGVLSTADNAFGCFLAGLAGEDLPLEPPGGKWTDAGVVLGPTRAVAWRTFDAQYFNLAQRRKRVFVVSSSRDGFDPAAVLFEWESVRRDSAPSRQARKGTASGAASGTGTGGWWDGGDLAATLTKQNASGAQRMPDKSNFGAVLQPVAVQGTVIGRSEHAGPQGSGADDSGAMFTLTKTDVRAVAFGGDIARTLQARHDSSPCADRSMDVVAVAFGGDIDLTGETAHTLQAKKTGGYSLNYQPGVMQTMQVRRLTPVECERLQGFPDGYTNIPWRGKPESPDGPRYKALGNSWAVPNVAWIGQRINAAVPA